MLQRLLSSPSDLLWGLPLTNRNGSIRTKEIALSTQRCQHPEEGLGHRHTENTVRADEKKKKNSTELLEEHSQFYLESCKRYQKNRNYWFARTSITNYHPLCSLKQQNFIIKTVQEVRSPKTRCQHSHTPRMKVIREESFSSFGWWLAILSIHWPADVSL
jgi:hypothetical protein